MVGILWTVLVVVLVLWLLGMVTSTAGNLVHVLLVIAAVIVLYNLLTGRRAV